MAATATEEATALWSGGETWSAILRELRDRGFSTVDAIRATAEVLRLPLSEAKHVVHFSDAWEETRENFERFHEVLESALENYPASSESSNDRVVADFADAVVAWRHGERPRAEYIAEYLGRDLPREDAFLLWIAFAARLVEFSNLDDDALRSILRHVANDQRSSAG